MKKRILLIGYSESIMKILKKKYSEGKIYLWTDHDFSSEELRKLWRRWIAVEQEHFSPEGENGWDKVISVFQKYIKYTKVTNVVIANESDIKNIQYYMELSQSEICKKKRVFFSVLIKERDSANILEGFFNSIKSKDIDLRIFNYEQIQAERMFVSFPLYKENDRNTGQSVHLLILGDDRFREEIAVAAMNQAVFSPTNKIFIDISGKNTNEVVEELKKKQLEASLETSLKEKSCQTDSSYQEIKEKKSLPSKEKKKAAKKAKAPKQKKTGILAWFSGKWKGIFSSDSKENPFSELWV